MMKPPAILRVLRHVCADTRGASAVEYGLIVASIMLVIFAALSQLGTSFGGLLQSIGNELMTATQ